MLAALCAMSRLAWRLRRVFQTPRSAGLPAGLGRPLPGRCGSTSAGDPRDVEKGETYERPVLYEPR